MQQEEICAIVGCRACRASTQDGLCPQEDFYVNLWDSVYDDLQDFEDDLWND
jgi:hypothetical protein